MSWLTWTGDSVGASVGSAVVGASVGSAVVGAGVGQGFSHATGQ